MQILGTKLILNLILKTMFKLRLGKQPHVIRRYSIDALLLLKTQCLGKKIEKNLKNSREPQDKDRFNKTACEILIILVQTNYLIIPHGKLKKN